MAKCCAMLLVGLVLASTLCSANAAGLVAAEPRRKLLLAEAGEILTGDLDIKWDLTKLDAGVKPGKVTLVVGGAETVAVTLKAGKVSKLTAAKVKVLDAVVRVRLEVVGVDKVIVLDLAKLKSTVVGGKLKAVVVLVLDKVKKVWHLQDQLGHCIIDICLAI